MNPQKGDLYLLDSEFRKRLKDSGENWALKDSMATSMCEDVRGVFCPYEYKPYNDGIAVFCSFVKNSSSKEVGRVCKVFFNDGFRYAYEKPLLMAKKVSK